MANIKEIIYAEMENITKVLIELEKVKDRPNKELVVLVGIGAYLQNIYTGMENVLKQLLSYKGILIPDTSTWHKENGRRDRMNILYNDKVDLLYM